MSQSGGGHQHIAESDNFVWDPVGMAWAKEQQPILNAGSVTVSGTIATTASDGSNVTFGSKADTADTTSTNADTHMAFLKGLVKILSSVWDSVNSRLKVDGSGVTQPVSGTITAGQGTAAALGAAWPVEVTDGANILATSTHPVRTDPTGTTTQPVSGTFWQTTQPVSGTVTGNQGTPNSIANAWPVEVTDGTNILGTSSHPVRVDPTGTTTQPVSGTVTANAGTGPATAWKVDLSATGANATAVKVDGSAVTQPVSGTVTANAGTGTFNTSDSHTTAGAPLSVELSDGAAFYVGAKTGQLPTALDGSGFLKVHEQGTATVSGTVTVNQGTAAAAAGSWPVEVTDGTNVLGVSAHPIRIDPTGTTTQPVSGTVSTTPPANASTNVAQFGGTNVVTGTGASGAGIPRVTISNDSSLAANQSVNVAQVAGLATVTAAAGVQKVGITGNAGAVLDAAGQNAASPANELLVAGQFNTSPTAISSGNISPLQLTSAARLIVDGSQVTQPVSGTVTANQGTANATPWNANVAQFGGNAVVTGTGASGVGIPRVTISNDSSLAANQSVNVNQIGGAAITLGSETSANSIPVVIASDQAAVTVAQGTPPWTQRLQDGVGAALATVTAGNALKVDGSAVTQPVSMATNTNADLYSLFLLTQNTLVQLLNDIRSELRITNTLLQSGLGVKDDLDNYRADPYWSSNTGYLGVN